MDKLERRIRVACIDVFDNPDDLDARALLVSLIPRESPVGSGIEGQLRVKTACQDLYDDPHNRAAQLQLLELL